MVIRALCLLGLVASGVVPALLLVAWFSGESEYYFAALVCGAFTITVLAWLKLTRHLAEATDAFESNFASLDAAAAPGGTEDLRRRLEALERHRGDADFDPWTALDLRRRLARTEKAEEEALAGEEAGAEAGAETRSE